MLLKKIKYILKKILQQIFIVLLKLRIFTKADLKCDVESIVLIMHSFQIGGAEKQWIYLANMLSKSFRVTLITLTSIDTHYKYLLNTDVNYISLDRIDHSDLKIPFLLRVFNKLFFKNIINENMRSILPLHYILKAIQPSIIVSQLDFLNVIAGIVSIINAKKCILSFRSYAPYHFDFYDERYYEIYKFFHKFNIIKFCGNSKLGNNDYAKWLDLNKKDIFLLNNLYFNISHSRPKASSNKNFIIFGAFRFSNEKNPLLFIQIAEKLIKNNSNFIFQIAGIGPLYDEMNRYIQHNKLQKNIHLLGYRPDVHILLQRADVLLSTSYYEGSSNIIIESLFSGIYVIASNTGSNKEMIYSKEYGTVVNSFDALPYVDSIMKYYKSNTKKRFSYQSKFTNELVMKQFNLILKSF